MNSTLHTLYLASEAVALGLKIAAAGVRIQFHRIAILGLVVQLALVNLAIAIKKCIKSR